MSYSIYEHYRIKNPPPCKSDCPNRNADCHSGSCEDWNKWHAEYQTFKAENDKKKQLHMNATGRDIDRMERIRKRMR